MINVRRKFKLYRRENGVADDIGARNNYIDLIVI
jgi:hypothetical protein